MVRALIIEIERDFAAPKQNHLVMHKGGGFLKSQNG